MHPIDSYGRPLALLAAAVLIVSMLAAVLLDWWSKRELRAWERRLEALDAIARRRSAPPRPLP